MKYIRTLTDVKLQSSFENFAENVMHPLEMSSSQVFVSSSTLRSSPQKVPSSRTSMIAAPVSIQSQLHTLGRRTPSQSEDRLTASGLLEVITSAPRPRSSTNDERMLRAPMNNGSDMHVFVCVCVCEREREREREREDWWQPRNFIRFSCELSVFLCSCYWWWNTAKSVYARPA